jgi:hypothetical protein
MTSDSSGAAVLDWRTKLPSLLSGRALMVREPIPHDSSANLELLSSGDASRRGLDGLVTAQVVRAFVEQVQRARWARQAITYAHAPPRRCPRSSQPTRSPSRQTN